MIRPFTSSIAMLRSVGLRPTRQRIALAKLLFDRGDQHFTAEGLHKKAREHRISISLATVYNALNQFTQKGLLKEIIVDSNRSYFDTNTSDHHHFFLESKEKLIDISAGTMDVVGLPSLPKGTEVDRIDIIIRII